MGNKCDILNNILLHSIDSSGSFFEIIPQFSKDPPETVLSIDSSGRIFWKTFPEFPEIPEIEIPDFSVIEDGKIRSTNIYYESGRIGISRPPLLNYKFDIGIDSNKTGTGFHIGDGKCGFSMGNGTSDGFIPEIIGMGFDEDDAGLYLLGKSGNSKGSHVPLVIIDGRSSDHRALINRPILGVTSGDYNNYKLVIDAEGNIGVGKIPRQYKMEVDGDIEALDLIIDGLSVRSLFDVIKEHQKEIDRLKRIIELKQHY
jgi:hypothetical protein